MQFPSLKCLSFGISSMSGALSVVKWTKNNPCFYDFLLTAYGVSKGKMLSKLKSPMTKMASLISYGLVAFDTFIDVKKHIGAWYSWQKTVASGITTAGVGVLSVWTSELIGA